MKPIILFAALALLLPATILHSEPERKPLIYQIDIRKNINNTTQLYLSRGMAEANRLGAEAILISLNTYGGQVDMADSMRTAILYSRIPVYVFIDNNAASAGALISIAAKKIYMREGASIGAATVVNDTGAAMPDKHQSYLRSMMRSTAEAHGQDTLVHGQDTIFRWKRDPSIAEAMVDERIAVPNVIDSGKVLTFTAREALKWGYCDGLAESVDEVVTHYLGYEEYETTVFSASFWDEIKGFLISPYVQSLLILVIIGGIYFELQTPGIGFPTAASITAAILYFSPLYIDGLAENWEILLFIAGILLTLVEIFIIPGFGLPGMAGIIFIIAGLTLSLINNTSFDFGEVSLSDYGRATMTVVAGICLSVISIIWLSSRIGSRGLLRNAALNSDLGDSVSVPVYQDMAGSEGITATVHRPSGKVIINGEIFDSISNAGFIEKGTTVKVVRAENAQIYVEPV
ncbi:MAG: nodulation protein NfeD [Tannerellaceae bacterium]|jgi:membrane-bound serine protease (ClpP class)|nr:nodulation protein NfeD [Tannerellaceae bacterium]